MDWCVSLFVRLSKSCAHLALTTKTVLLFALALIFAYCMSYNASAENGIDFLRIYDGQIALDSYDTPLWGIEDNPEWKSKPGMNDSVHPISPDGFNRSFTPPRSLLQDSWTRVVDALDAGNPITIVVIGGSSEAQPERCSHLLPHTCSHRASCNPRSDYGA